MGLACTDEAVSIDFPHGNLLKIEKFSDVRLNMKILKSDA